MKMTTILLAGILGSQISYAADEVTVTVDSHTNASNYLLETCGTAKHAGGLKPLTVTVKHDESNYTTLTDKDGKWCVVIKRWKYNGEVAVEASVLMKPELTSEVVKFTPSENK